MKIRITAIKFEVVNGKRVGKAFTFEMDPKEMAQYKTLPTVHKKIEEYVAKTRIFRRDELKELQYDMAEFLQEWRIQVRQESRATPDSITRLGQNEILVYGSDEKGAHDRCAAEAAYKRFVKAKKVKAAKEELQDGDAPQKASADKEKETEVGLGFHDRSYAIQTTGGLKKMEKEIKAFIKFAKKHPELHFLVTEIGCIKKDKKGKDAQEGQENQEVQEVQGVQESQEVQDNQEVQESQEVQEVQESQEVKKVKKGLEPSQVASYFEECKNMPNVSLPFSFRVELRLEDRQEEE